MSRDVSTGENTTKQDMTWDALIKHSEVEIQKLIEKQKILRKSLNYFKKQADSGIPFPAPSEPRQKEIS
jgi:hypothetical protein